MDTKEELELLKTHLFRICGLHNEKNILLNKAIADAKSLLMELYPEPITEWSKDVEWRVCPDFPDYEVSNYGEVRRCKVCSRNRKSFEGKVLKPKIEKRGYHQYNLSKGTKKYYLTAHKLVAITFIGLPLDKSLMIAHLDGNKSNNFVGNLKWVSNSENQLHRREHENFVPLRGNNSLTVEQVKNIRKKFESGINQSKLAEEYGVSHGVINRLVNGVSYTRGIYCV
jgi:hypothetical protein